MYKFISFSLFFCVLCLLFSPILLAQNEESDSLDIDLSLEMLGNLSAEEDPSALQQVLNKKVTAATKRPLPSRETPNIVSIITAEELRKSGARDLIDALRLVPGLDFAQDVLLVTGVGVRGNWAHEGKMLMLIDGVEMNEILYQTLQFGGRYSVHNIERIEVIKGPGSAVYGGAAAYGVINVITKSGYGQEGISAEINYGQLQSVRGRQNVSLSAGKSIGKWYIGMNAFLNEALRSDQTDLVSFGTTHDLRDNSGLNSSHLNLSVQSEEADFKVIYDQYKMNTYAGFAYDFSTFITDLKYKFHLNENFFLTPHFVYSEYRPWTQVGRTDDGFFDIRARRLRTSLVSGWSISRNLNLTSGVEYFQDLAEDLAPEGQFSGGWQNVEGNYVYNNLAIYSQALFKHWLANFTLGARYDFHDVYGGNFAPRVGATKRIEDFHFKLLYGNAFRAPSIQNIHLASDIRPERSNVLELETGYQFTPKMLLVGNTFYMRTRDPIVYEFGIVDGNEVERYSNEPLTGSWGFELEYRYKAQKAYLNLGYSFYRSLAAAMLNQVPSHEGIFAGFPGHKLSLNSSLDIGKNLSLSPSAIFGSMRAIFNSAAAEEDRVQAETLAPYLLANLFIEYRNILVDGLHAGVGVYDIFNQRPLMPSPYFTVDTPFRSISREFTFRLSYDFKFKSKENSVE
ncbi:MAG: TonB-dependent receptor plug domain-containing protein [Bernardetiaceae bacterium]|nr:TonB-dependent receptor plug domain-containing protein [Bernardetiaceae bacterium]